MAKPVSLGSDTYGAIRLIIFDQLPKGRLSVELVRMHLGVSRSSLTRWLKDHGFEFSKLVDELRLQRIISLAESMELPGSPDWAADQLKLTAVINEISRAIGLKDKIALHAYLGRKGPAELRIREKLYRHVQAQRLVDVEAKLERYLFQLIKQGQFRTTVFECARALKIPKKNLTAWLKSQGSGGVARRLEDVRFKVAERLGMNPELPVATIARRVGYSLTRTLLKAYKMRTGRDLRVSHPGRVRRPRKVVDSREPHSKGAGLSGVDLVNRVTTVLVANLWDPSYGLDRLAKSIRTPVRKIQPRLRGAGTSFYRIRARLRLQDANKRLRRSKGDINRVAGELGYRSAWAFQWALASWVRAEAKSRAYSSRPRRA